MSLPLLVVVAVKAAKLPTAIRPARTTSTAMVRRIFRFLSLRIYGLSRPVLGATHLFDRSAWAFNVLRDGLPPAPRPSRRPVGAGPGPGRMRAGRPPARLRRRPARAARAGGRGRASQLPRAGGRAGPLPGQGGPVTRGGPPAGGVLDPGDLRGPA